MPFVIAAIVLDCGAAMWYSFQGDAPRTLYWLAAALISVATLLIKK